MSAVPWIALAVVAAAVFFDLAIGATLPSGREPGATDGGERVPLAALQKAALWTLAAGLALVAAVVALIVRRGVAVWWDDAAVRLPVTALMLAALFASLAPMVAARRRAKAGRVTVDERDLAILERAPRLQGAAVLVCVALWTAGLLGAFGDRGQVPVAFVVLLCWSCLLTHALALPAGILSGYRRA